MIDNLIIVLVLVFVFSGAFTLGWLGEQRFGKKKEEPKKWPTMAKYAQTPKTAQTTYAFQLVDIASRIYIANIPECDEGDQARNAIEEAANLIKAGTVHFDKIDKQKADETVKQNSELFNRFKP